ncbi:MAG: YdcF family protein, partial [Lachnospiraceae bacterium]|nr:YdcF family protein [Candidatus Minthocola equi]
IIIIKGGKKKLVSDDAMQALGADCILILGAGVRDDNHPSPILADRLEEGLRLYKNGISQKIIVSGDHGRVDYDEVNVMKQYLIDAGVPSEDIFMDHAGFSTYESMYRAKEIFGAQKVILVTQEYHLYRALYICDRLGIEAYGSPSDYRAYAGALMRNIREWIARDKDIIYCAFKVKPTYLGDAIDLNGSGDITND